MQHAEATLDERIPLAVLMLTQHELITASLAELRHLQRRSSHKDVRVFHVPLTSKELTASDAEPLPARLGHLELRAGTSDNDGPLDELLRLCRARKQFALALAEPRVALAGARERSLVQLDALEGDDPDLIANGGFSADLRASRGSASCSRLCASANGSLGPCSSHASHSVLGV